MAAGVVGGGLNLPYLSHMGRVWLWVDFCGDWEEVRVLAGVAGAAMVLVDIVVVVEVALALADDTGDSGETVALTGVVETGVVEVVAPFIDAEVVVVLAMECSGDSVIAGTVGVGGLTHPSA